MSTMDFLKVIVILQILFSFSTTMIVYSLPDDALKSFMMGEARMEHGKSTGEIISEFNKTASSMKQSSLINTAFLLFYTGNLLIDLFMNFLFAIPEMLTIPWNLFCYVFHVDPTFQGGVSMIIFAIASVIYMIVIISLIVQIRSGRTIV